MNFLFNQRGWGRLPSPRSKPSAQIHHGRPEFHFDFDLAKGMNRAKVDQWPIEGFLGQMAAVDLKALASLAKRPLLAVETDWINLALAIYSADRFASRRPSAALGDKFWRRSISLNVAVADPNCWNSLKQAILDALTFLTDDDWSLHFTQRKIGLSEERQEQLQEANCEKPSWICLFSGGLDSLAGVKHLSQQVGGKGLLVSGWTNERLRCGQEELISRLPEHRGSAFEWLQVYYGFPRILDSTLMESSQRSRGWMHVALGLAAAAVSRHSVLDVCENGIGAINLPTEFSQTGSHTSRAVHPVFLSRIAKAASLVFGKPLSIRQPALFETKGELLRRALHPGDAEAINASFSCEIFPNYNAKQSQCGVCPSCLVRRAALNSAGLPDSGKRYAFDAKAHILPTKRALGMTKMNRYAKRIESCFADSAPPDAALWEYPEAGSYFEEAAASLNMPFEEFLSNMRRMHHAFSLEWKEFAAELPHIKQAGRLAA